MLKLVFFLSSNILPLIVNILEVKYYNYESFLFLREVVVAQLVERLLSIPEVRGSTPIIGKILLNICLLSTVLKR